MRSAGVTVSSANNAEHEIYAPLFILFGTTYAVTLVDTGAAVSLNFKSLASKIIKPVFNSDIPNKIGADDFSVLVCGCTVLPLTPFPLQTVYVTAYIVDELPHTS